MSKKCEKSSLSVASHFTALNLEWVRDGREADIIEITAQHIDKYNNYGKMELAWANDPSISSAS